jgi:geranylgeranyl pyrophosphate synthase
MGLPIMSLLPIEQLKVQVDEFLQDYFDRKIESSHIYGSSYQDLLRHLKEFILRGGKRLRPYLSYLGYNAARPHEGELPVQVLVAVELFHQALLIHDDIIDQDDFRYGGPNIIGAYQDQMGRRGAESIALLAGDMIETMAVELSLEGEAKPSSKIKVMKMLIEQFQEVLAGQFLDSVPYAHSFERLEDVLLIHRYKTASYSAMGPLKVGFVLSGSRDRQLERALQRYGEALGLLFGLTDDLIGMFGDEEISGKPACSDLHEAKPTALFLYAKQQMNEADARLFHLLLGQPHTDDENLKGVRRALTRSGAKAQTEALASGYAKKAVAALGGFDGLAIDILRELPHEVLARKR